MSRSGYSEDCDDNWALIRYRGQVSSATNGARGQRFLREALTILDAMPVKELAAETLQSHGQFCTIGAIRKAKDLVIPSDDSAWGQPRSLACDMDVSWQLVAEIIYENDECSRWNETPSQRWERMRGFVANQIKEPQS